MTIRCPISQSSQISLIEKIKISDLLHLYHQMLGSDISAEFDDLEELGFYHCPESDLRFFDPVVTGSEHFYEQLQAFDWYYLDDKPEFDYARQFVRSSDSVLEIGCGKGAFAQKISAQQYIGLELSTQAQELALSSNVKVLKQSIQSHATNHTGEYDVVCAFQVLEHIGDIHSFIQSSLQCLKPGGLLIYSVPSADSFVALARNNILNLPPHHISWWSDQSLAYVGQKFQLKIMDIHHDKLADIHRKWYISTVLFESFCRNFGLQFSLLERSLLYRVLAKLSRIGSPFLEKGLLDIRMLPNGHSVTVVYQKGL